MSITGVQFLQAATRYLGVPYVWGGSSLSGVDCSGLVWAVANAFGLSIPRTSGAQYQALIHVDPSQTQMGDLVFFDADFSDGGTVWNHVGIYAGNGNVLVADHSGTVVHIVPIATEARVSGVARIPGVIPVGNPDGALRGVTLASLNSALGFNSNSLIPATRPNFDIWGALGMQSPNSQIMNENFGLAAAFLETDPELSNLYSQAVAGSWSQDQFISMLQQTTWWATHGNQARNLLQEKTQDPAKYQQDLTNEKQKVSEQAVALGVHMSDQSIESLTSMAMMLGYNDEQINAALSKYLTMSKDGHFGGYAGQVELGLREYARDMGIPLTNDYITNAVQGIVAGTDTLQARRAYIQTQAEMAFPAYKSLIQQGVTVGEIAAPFLAAQSQIWEIDPNKIDLFDPTLRGAITKTTAPNDKTPPIPTMLSLTDFETQLRQDPKWLVTNNARESMLATAHSVLDSMGLTASSLGQAPTTQPNSVSSNSLNQSQGPNNTTSLEGMPMTSFPTLQGAMYQVVPQAPTIGPADVGSLAPNTSFQPQIGGPNNKGPGQ